jgi:microcompartment protein CcmK/EutM
MAQIKNSYVVAVDTVGAGYHEQCFGSRRVIRTISRRIKGYTGDAAIIGVIDTIDTILGLMKNSFFVLT